MKNFIGLVAALSAGVAATLLLKRLWFIRKGCEMKDGRVDTSDTREWVKQELRASFEAGIEYAAERAATSEVHPIIPYHFFSAASSECREMFIHGHFYGCISLAQAVAEGLGRFVAIRNNVRLALLCQVYSL